MLRLFVAIPIPDAIKKQISAACASFKGEKWTPENNLHITVHFIGNMHPDDIPLLANKLRAIAFQFEPFELRFKEVCAIANRKRPMIWIRLHHSEPLELLASLIAEVTGSEPDLPFTPHITLLRLPEETNRGNKARLLAQIPVNPFEITVTKIEIWESLPDVAGRKYTCLQKFPFGNE